MDVEKATNCGPGGGFTGPHVNHHAAVATVFGADRKGYVTTLSKLGLPSFDTHPSGVTLTRSTSKHFDLSTDTLILAGVGCDF